MPRSLPCPALPFLFLLLPFPSWAASSDLLVSTEASVGDDQVTVDARSGESDSTAGGKDAAEGGRLGEDASDGGDTGLPQAESGGEDAGGDGRSDATLDPGVACGTGPYCTSPSQFCCISSNGFGNPQTRCVSNICGGAGNGGTSVHCDDTADCASGQVCCALDIGGSITSVSCQTTCGPSGIITTYDRFCDPKNNDCPSIAPTCAASPNLMGYNVCM
jgi:hypothetical protein